MAADRALNRLARATSPYLLQHASNPVDWYEWGEEALGRARREDRPILLSIGYAACHWCHVMAHESFEDEETALFMNERFVCIKVDREERPDIDSIYMDAVQAMTGSGGWPLTAFLTPDGTPFYAGTYFPKEDRHGLPSFRRVLEGIVEAWQARRADVLEQGRRIVRSLEANARLRESSDPLTEDVLREGHAALRRAFDAEWGGFGRAPKFPQPMTLEFLLRAHLRGLASSLDMVTHTLDRMASGGVRDQVGGGFHRYSVDGTWHVPHFEKMLYDNAQLARLYARAWQVSGRDEYRRVAEDTLDYLLREMRAPGGGFFSSQDADSEGEEGRFFVWSNEELIAVAARASGDRTAGAAVATYFGATPDGNWEGTNVLWTPLPMSRVAARFGLDPSALAAHVDGARRALFDVREARPRPGTDDKVLTAWNGLAIAAFAEAGRVFQDARYVDAAARAASFVLEHLVGPDGRLLRSWREGKGGGPAFLDDYALLAQALLTLYETTFDLRFFTRARNLADDLMSLFRDPDGGGFFQTASDAEALVVRPKELFDNAVPSGNSVAAEVLQRLALMTGEARYEEAGVSALRLVRDHMIRAPSGFGHALCALDLYLSPVREVAIVGDPGDEATRRLVEAVHRRFLPNSVLAAAPAESPATSSIGLLRDRRPMDGRATAYVCERFVCGRPVTDPDELVAQLTG